MMRKLLAVFLLICLSDISQGQNFASNEPLAHTRHMRFGIYFAPNISWMRPTSSKADQFEVKSGGSRVGYTWGLMIDYSFAENYGITTGLQINTTGGIIKATNQNPTPGANSVQFADFNYRLQYLEIPFQLKLQSEQLNEVGGIRIIGHFGLTPGINIGKTASYDVQYIDQNFQQITHSSKREKVKGTFSVAPITLQLNVGAGIEKDLTEKLTAYFGIFFNNGFFPDATNPSKYELDYQGSFSDGNIRLNSFSFRFGIFF